MLGEVCSTYNTIYRMTTTIPETISTPADAALPFLDPLGHQLKLMGVPLLSHEAVERYKK
ncbi:MAG: hypothetical protein Greene041679_189 [Parcubacteria group bacterium Greene0416_79]|nr:MAG: hypothetical protein Greene041679_189 [Parcubacteria group bacterium Greene0416_79]